MTTFAYTTGNPANLTGGAPASMNDIKGPFDDLRTFLNGSNLSDTQLVSPNNAIWRTYAESPFIIGSGTTAGDYYFNHTTGQTHISGSQGFSAPVRLDPAGFVVAGKTAKLRLSVSMFTGAAPGLTPVFGIYGVGTLTSASGNPNVPLLGTLAGSTATFTTPGANAYFSGSSAAFDFPGSVGGYMFGVNLPGTTANPSSMIGRLTLAVSHV